MKRALLSGLSAGLLALCGCAAGISRQGYTLGDVRQPGHPTDCHLAFKCKATYESNEVEVVGHIKAYDTSVSVTCDEAYILDIFSKEACALGADVVNVTDEHYPSFWSTCYQAKAEF